MKRRLQGNLQPDSLRDRLDLGSGATYWHALYALRMRYQEQDCDRWPPAEFAQLRFLRWLAETGRLIDNSAPMMTAEGARVSDQ